MRTPPRNGDAGPPESRPNQSFVATVLHEDVKRVLELLPVAAMVASSDGGLVWANPSGKQIYRRSGPSLRNWILCATSGRTRPGDTQRVDIGMFTTPDGETRIRGTSVPAQSVASRCASMRMVILVAEEHSGDSRSENDLDLLTPTERRLAGEIGGGRSVREAATAMGVSYNTARKHMQNIYSKLDVNNRVQLLIRLQRLEFVPSDVSALDRSEVAA